MTDLSCSLGAASSRLLCFKYIKCGYFAGLETVLLALVQSNWPLSLCRVGSCAQRVCCVFERRFALPAAWSRQYYLRTGASKLEHDSGHGCGAYRDADVLFLRESCRIPRPTPV